MKYIIKVVAVVCILFLACKNNAPVDVTGVYVGEFPCADCIGIDNKMTLNTDSTFVLEKVYKGKGDEHTYKQEGTYVVKEGKLILELKKSPFKYAIGNNYIELLDIDGHKIESELNYKLIKQE
ncbi:copper resistance protein NlpE N-terminal domain-containing protein [Polaribacter sp. Z014]|uniref:copper resistance protein NlpE n=1 Tax=Polaribacter sp. Z014 TaxID=2927126 RepID=UPI0020205F43|nr:copper resistance protein NlpE [Polaribacter sp. Z014]MCL7764179.1 copper resistance protein NlpE N-terminal domain-containing protein [Polaribacter sp. Z014]